MPFSTGISYSAGTSLGYDYETVVEAASGLVTDTETCDEF